MHHVLKRSVGVLVVLSGLVALLGGCNQATTPTPTPAPTPQPSRDYTLTLSPATLSTGLAGSAGTSLSVSSQGGFGGTLTLSLRDGSGYPASGASLSRNSVTLTSGQNASVPLKITAAASEPAGTYHFTLHASGGGIAHTSPLTLTLSSVANGTFAPASGSPYGAGSTVTASVAVGDFNGDGKPDLAIGHNSGDTVSVLLGNGDGTFQAAVSYPAGSGYSVAVGDFNGDGKLDLVTANIGGSFAGTVSVLLGNGDGSFQNAVNYPAGSVPYTVAVGDFNGDGKPDLAVANNVDAGTVSVLLGNGDGTFQAATSYSVGAYTDPGSVAVGDFNGDGKPDLVTANGNNKTVSVLLGNGDGTFRSAVSSAAGGGAYTVAVGDFNGDGRPDLATTNGSVGGVVSVLLGNGDGTFQTAKNYGVGRQPESVAIGDFNGDGSPDLVVTNFNTSPGVASVLLGNGDGTFQAPLNYGAGAGPYSIAVEDFNGDGKLDLAVVNASSPGIVSVLLGQ